MLNSRAVALGIQYCRGVELELGSLIYNSLVGSNGLKATNKFFLIIMINFYAGNFLRIVTFINCFRKGKKKKNERKS